MAFDGFLKFSSQDMKRPTSWFLPLLVGTLSFGIISCGGSEKSAPEKPAVAVVEQKPAPATGESKKKLSIPERLAALKELGRKFQSLPAQDLKADNQAMLSWIQIPAGIRSIRYFKKRNRVGALHGWPHSGFV